MLGVTMWALLNEVFLTETPEDITSKAVKMISENREVGDRLGENVNVDGQPQIQEYIHGNFLYKRVAFRVWGETGQGQVHLEMKTPTAGGTTKYRYMLVEIAASGLAPKKVVIIEDNRGEDAADAAAAN
mmetsp:Transcript_28867/g.86657  ORF Transcript_28867/g.86657 Transcript_28867/m.86657 type:complete len:129 (+) Transcript_28867:74-460(+)